ncbi:MAG: M14 family metallopeptidase [Candidatus Sedimenticola sp. (ex Thyasira tokunagai)]
MVQISNHSRYAAIFIAAMLMVIFAHDLAALDFTSYSNALDHYSVDYQEARLKFLDAARASGGRIENHENPIVGPNNQPLYVDVAAFGPADPTEILVLSSGTHGVEGFVGSAIQTGLLREGIPANLGPGTGLIVIHAINPYGFAYLRRMNEDNVDLNRNFLNHSLKHPENPGYDELADAIAPESISFWSDTKARLHLLFYRVRRGATALRHAISSGQYSHPLGLFYGGQYDTWSNKTIRTIAKRHLAGAKRVVVIDFHSGLGSYAAAEVILNVPKESPAYLRAAKWWGNRVKTTVNGKSVSIHPQGTLKLAFPRMIQEAVVTAVSLEFGTLPPMDVFWALRAENWLHHHGNGEHPDSKRIKQALLGAFYPDNEHWKQLAWQQGREVVLQAMEQLKVGQNAQQ